MEIEAMKSLFQNKKVKWSNQCLERMEENQISKQDMENCILKGEVMLNYQEGFPYPDCLFIGADENRKDICVAVGCDSSYLYVVAASCTEAETRPPRMTHLLFYSEEFVLGRLEKRMSVQHSLLPEEAEKDYSSSAFSW